jgi:hypothetical protein
MHTSITLKLVIATCPRRPMLCAEEGLSSIHNYKFFLKNYFFIKCPTSSPQQRAKRGACNAGEGFGLVFKAPREHSDAERELRRRNERGSRPPVVPGTRTALGPPVQRKFLFLRVLRRDRARPRPRRRSREPEPRGLERARQHIHCQLVAPPVRFDQDGPRRENPARRIQGCRFMSEHAPGRADEPHVRRDECSCGAFRKKFKKCELQKKQKNKNKLETS